jgi:glycerol-3-phosphate dehydrogenase (NAD(P)+)
MNVTICGCGRWASFHVWYQSTVLKNNVLVWGRKDEMYDELSTSYSNKFLTIPKSVKFTNDIDAAMNFSKYVVISISAQAMPEFSKCVGFTGVKDKTFILAMKGIIDNTGERLSQVFKREIDASNKIVCLVGPGHTQDFVAGKPSIMLVDSEDPLASKDVAATFKSSLIRVYVGDDLIGAEIGAAAKNVIGIAAGILDGSHWECMKGPLMARGCYEVAKLIVALGGNHMTAYGLSHLGDYDATLYSKNSNNRQFGENFVNGVGTKYLAEGVATCKAVRFLAKKHNVEMPICNAVYEVLFEKRPINDAFNELLERYNDKEFKFFV